VLSAGQQPKLMFVVNALSIKLDDEGAEAVGFLAGSFDTKIGADRFVNAAANIEVRCSERFVACIEQLV
jgi:hypothetical protein